MINSSLSNYSGVYIHVKGTIRAPNTAADAAPVKNIKK